MAKGEPPYANLSPYNALFLIPKNEPPSLEDSKFSKAFKEFVMLCLQKNPQDRLPASELLKHKFIRTAKKNSILIDLLQRKAAFDSTKRPKKTNDESDDDTDTSLDDLSDDGERFSTTQIGNNGFWVFDTKTNTVRGLTKEAKIQLDKELEDKKKPIHVPKTESMDSAYSSVSSVSTIASVTPKNRRVSSQDGMTDDEESSTQTTKTIQRIEKPKIVSYNSRDSVKNDSVKRVELPTIMSGLMKSNNNNQTVSFMKDIIAPSFKESKTPQSSSSVTVILDELDKIEKNNPQFAQTLLSNILSRVQKSKDTLPTQMQQYMPGNAESLSFVNNFDARDEEKLDVIGKNLLKRWKIKVKSIHQ